MSAQHTPAPWSVEAIPDARGLGRRVFTDRIEIKQYGGLIACLHAKNWGLDGASDLANANLIASAPDLLAALRELHRVCAAMDLEHEANRPSEAEYIDAMEAANAAIAKATGSADHG